MPCALHGYTFCKYIAHNLTFWIASAGNMFTGILILQALHEDYYSAADVKWAHFESAAE